MQIIVVENPEKGIQKAKEILYEKVDKKTVLFLSGGNTPRSLYEILAKEKIIRPVAVGMVDERYGEPFHENSNELMVRETGFLDYLKKQGVPFYPVLHKKKNLEQTAAEYDQIARDLFFKFPRSIAVMGVGKDGHTAGMPPSRISNVKFQMSNFKELVQKENIYNTHQFVLGYKNKHMDPPERLTMSFAGLHLIDFFIVLIFGKDKKKTLKMILENGSLEEIPARFFPQEASEKTLIITDQQV